jgi:hypothetical protein
MHSAPERIQWCVPHTSHVQSCGVSVSVSLNSRCSLLCFVGVQLQFLERSSLVLRKVNGKNNNMVHWVLPRYSTEKSVVTNAWKAKLRALLDPLLGTYNGLVRALRPVSAVAPALFYAIVPMLDTQDHPHSRSLPACFLITAV